MPSFFEGHANFAPDSTQSFGDEWVRFAASQNLIRGTPQYEKQEIAAASQSIRDEFFTPQGRARRERAQRQREYERLEGEERLENKVCKEESVEAEDDLPELKDDDDVSVASLDVGLSQAYTSDNRFDGVVDVVEEAEVDSNYPMKVELDAVIESHIIKEEEEEVGEEAIHFDITFPPVEDESDNESTVSMDQGLTQVVTSSDECIQEPIDVKPEESEDTRLMTLNALTEAEQLLGWQALCRETGRTIGSTIRECRALLKKKPYINIVDYIDAARIGTKIEEFDDFAKFSHYTRTTPGKRINLKYAKEDELLSALLQKLDRGFEKSRQSAGNRSFRHQRSDHCTGSRKVQGNFYRSGPRPHGLRRRLDPPPHGQPRRPERSFNARCAPY